MTRLRPEEIIDQVRRLQTDVVEINAAQRLGGSSVLGYLTSSALPNDYSFTLAPSATVKLSLKFTNSTATAGSIQQLFFYYSLDQPDVMANQIPPWTNGPPAYAVIQKLPPTATQNEWRIAVINNGGVSWQVYFKLFFSGTDSGSWSISVIP